MRLVLLIAAVLLSAEAAHARPAPESTQREAVRVPLLGLDFERRKVPLRPGVNFPQGHGTLAKVSPLTLRPVSRGVRVGGFVFGFDASPDGRRVAVGVGTSGRIKIVDLRSMRSVGDLRLPVREPVAYLRWAGRDRVLAVTVFGNDVAWEINTATGAVLTRKPLAGTSRAVERFDGGLAVLLSPARGVGPARLAIVRSGSAPRTVALPGIRAGSAPRGDNHEPLPGSGPDLFPGLAVGGDAAWVVSAEGFKVARVDLETGAVAVRSVGTTARASKGGAYSSREAGWLGGGRLAVAGVDAGDRERPFGLRVVDTTTWRARSLDGGAQSLRLAAGAVLHPSSAALRAFEPGGARRFEFRPRFGVSYVETAGNFAYVHNAARRARDRRTHVVDVSTGRRRATLRTAGLPTLLAR